MSSAGHLPQENRADIRPLDGTRTQTLRFAPDEPPVDGFWSLTVYGDDGFFVDNPIDRYSLSDRTSGVRRDGDGGLTVVVGHEPPADAAHWLPTPAGPCRLALRAYEGHSEVVDARWFGPDLVPAPAPDPGV